MCVRGINKVNGYRTNKTRVRHNQHLCHGCPRTSNNNCLCHRVSVLAGTGRITCVIPNGSHVRTFVYQSSLANKWSWSADEGRCSENTGYNRHFVLFEVSAHSAKSRYAIYFECRHASYFLIRIPLGNQRFTTNLSECHGEKRLKIRRYF